MEKYRTIICAYCEKEKEIRVHSKLRINCSPKCSRAWCNDTPKREKYRKGQEITKAE